MARQIVIAIDGPAGAGKTTVAWRLARALGYLLLDTGALYRAVALAAKHDEIAWDDEAAVGELAERLVGDRALLLRQADAAEPSAGLQVLLRGQDVGGAIRQSDISMGASRVSAVVRVRDALLDLQREIGAHGGVVAEGRDIGTVVFPHAEVKFFLTAGITVRAERRYQELCGQGERADIEEVKREIVRRDQQDSERSVAPLRAAGDALWLDSSDRDADSIVAEMTDVVAQRTH